MTCTPLFLFWWCVYKNAKISSSSSIKSPSNGHTCGIYAQLSLLCAAPVIYDHVVQENPRGISALGGQNSPKNKDQAFGLLTRGHEPSQQKCLKSGIFVTQSLFWSLSKRIQMKLNSTYVLQAHGIVWPFCLSFAPSPQGQYPPQKLNLFLSFDRY